MKKTLKLTRDTIRILSDMHRIVGGIPQTATEQELCIPSGIHTCAHTCPIPTQAPCPHPL